MKAYVLYYGPEPHEGDETPDEREARLTKPPVIQYGPEPLWTLANEYEANVELGIVRRGGYFVGPHFCEFELDKLPGGKFAIFCVNHPTRDPLAPYVVG